MQTWQLQGRDVKIDEIDSEIEQLRCEFIRMNVILCRGVTRTLNNSLAHRIYLTPASSAPVSIPVSTSITHPIGPDCTQLHSAAFSTLQHAVTHKRELPSPDCTPFMSQQFRAACWTKGFIIQSQPNKPMKFSLVYLSIYLSIFVVLSFLPFFLTSGSLFLHTFLPSLLSFLSHVKLLFSTLSGDVMRKQGCRCVGVL